jgi:hypothetical protein
VYLKFKKIRITKINANHKILIRYIPIQAYLRSQINLIADVHRRSFHVQMRPNYGHHSEVIFHKYILA